MVCFFLFTVKQFLISNSYFYPKFFTFYTKDFYLVILHILVIFFFPDPCITTNYANEMVIFFLIYSQTVAYIKFFPLHKVLYLVILLIVLNFLPDPCILRLRFFLIYSQPFLYTCYVKFSFESRRLRLIMLIAPPHFPYLQILLFIQSSSPINFTYCVRVSSIFLHNYADYAK